MTDKIENRELFVSGILNTVNDLSKKLEQLGTKKKALTELPDTSTLGKVLEAHKKAVKNIANEAKKTKEKIAKNILCLDVFEACKVVTTLCQSPTDSDTAYRQKMSRRRNALKGILVTTFPDFDFRNDKIANRAIITPIFIGDEYTREANTLLATLERLTELGYTMPALERDNLAETLKSQAGITKVYADTKVNDDVPAVKDTVADIEAMFTGKTETVEEQQNEEQQNEA